MGNVSKPTRACSSVRSAPRGSLSFESGRRPQSRRARQEIRNDEPRKQATTVVNEPSLLFATTTLKRSWPSLLPGSTPPKTKPPQDSQETSLTPSHRDSIKGIHTHTHARTHEAVERKKKPSLRRPISLSVSPTPLSLLPSPSQPPPLSLSPPRGLPPKKIAIEIAPIPARNVPTTQLPHFGVEVRASGGIAAFPGRRDRKGRGHGEGGGRREEV
jgi:hypothetical protein